MAGQVREGADVQAPGLPAQVTCPSIAADSEEVFSWNQGKMGCACCNLLL